MSIHQLTRERLITVTSSQRSLNPGQIIQGKILKIYPNNKAQIQLGSQKMIAQLEASLSIGERYHFQVQSADELIHLKVVGDRLTTQAETNAQNLLDTLGLKANRANINFVQTLINDKTPFEKNRLIQAFELIENMKKSPGVKDVVRKMIVNKLPLTLTVFQAVHTIHFNEVSDVMKALLQELQQAPSTTQLNQTLINRLNQLIERPVMTGSIFAQQILSLSTSDQQQLFNVFKNIGLISKHTDIATWQSNLLTSVNESSTSSIPHPNQESAWQMNEVNIRQALRQMNTNGAVLQTEAKLFLEQWGQTIQQSITTNKPLTENRLSQLQGELTRNIIPLLTQEHGGQIQPIQNNRVNISELYTLLQTLSNEQTFTKTDQLIANVNQQEMFINSSLKEQLLIQIRQVLSFTGLSYEHTLTQDMVEEEQTATIKSMLIQLTQQADGTANERAQQLLHIINGLQLQSVNETSNFIQASLLVPGEKLQLNNDLYLDFESKKTEDGKVNPDYCRILFYLDLANLKETIIDMNIQKRLVTVTVFNDYKQAEKSLEPLQKTLKESLSLIDYQLATVSFKPLHQVDPKNQSNVSLQSTNYQNSYEGFDYRV